MNLSRGSVWRRWDLHIHSPITILNNQYLHLPDGSVDWESYIAALEKLEIAVLGVTDYFTIDGYKKVLEYKRQGRLKNIETIIPNIEFRLDKVVASKKDGEQPRRLNFHVLFSEEVSVQDIEEHFLHDIDFYYEGNPQDQDEKRKLKVSNLEALGKKLKAQHPPFAGESDLVVGAKQAVISHEEITKKLTIDSRFRGKYVLVFPEEYSSLIDWDGQDHHTRKGLLQKSDFVFSANSSTRDWCLGKGKYVQGPEKFQEEYKSLKACIHGSDAHEFAHIGYPCALRGSQGHDCVKHQDKCQLRHCWVKADPTFEGLRQLLFEPEERVLIQDSDPSPVRHGFTIDKVSLGGADFGDELVISDYTLEMNAGLVAVTGGKGSGKTAFVDLIASCYADRGHSRDPNSFVRRVFDTPADPEIKLNFRNGDEFRKRLKEKKFIQETEVIYVAQGELENYVGEKSDLSAFVHELIFDSPVVRGSSQSFGYREFEEQEQLVEQELEKLNGDIASAEVDTSEEVVVALTRERKQREAELRDIEARIQELQKALTPEQLAIAQERERELSALKAKREILVELRTKLTSAIEFLDVDLKEFNAKLLSINALLKSLALEESYASVDFAQREVLNIRVASTKSEIATLTTQIEAVQRVISNFHVGVRDHALLLEKRTELLKLLEVVKAKEEKLTERRTHLGDLVSKRKQVLKNLLSTHLHRRDSYAEIIASFAQDKSDVLSDLTFIATPAFESEALLKRANDVMDNRKVQVRTEEDRLSFLSDLIDRGSAVAAEGEAKIDDYVKEVERLAVEFRGKIKSSSTVSVKDYYGLLYRNYFRLSPEIRYKKTSLTKLSLGQKATVLIKIYLAQGDKPIIIDSHDDHLDNEFIMDELVKALRQAKKYRQVILASNNGNVVVNSDAEQLIIASRNENKIEYVAGSLENPQIRERAIKVLEGGKDAFQQRQRKYRLHQAG